MRNGSSGIRLEGNKWLKKYKPNVNRKDMLPFAHVLQKERESAATIKIISDFPSSYDVCIRPESGFCCIRYTACTDTSSDFAPARRRRSLDDVFIFSREQEGDAAGGVSRMPRQVVAPVLPNLGLVGSFCTSDYITIEGK